MDDPNSREARIRILESCGAESAHLEELLRYTDRVLCPPEVARAVAIDDDEPHVAVWREYIDEARAVGAFEALATRFVQLRFPVQAGISLTDSYRAATRRGEFEAAGGFPTRRLERPDDLDLTLAASMCGAIPILTAATRADFEWLVSAFTARNEPGTVPASMGACIVSGLVNWDRVARQRAAWESTRSSGDGSASWPRELLRLSHQKELYQDRFVILSRGPYSAVAARDVGMDKSHWLERSLVIRREHELTHYFTQRRFGSMQNHVLDEIVADFVGLLRAMDEYRADLATSLLGGRIGLYRGNPPLSDAALGVIRVVSHRAIENLAALTRGHESQLRNLPDLAETVAQVGSQRLEALAAPEMPERVGALLVKKSI